MVDDSKLNRLILSKKIEGMGYKTDVAEDGQECLDKLNDPKNHFDAIVMDIQMPVKDGFETTSEIRSSQKNYACIPIIGATGDNSPEILQQMKEAEFDGYIEKTDTEFLEAKLKALIPRN